MILIDLFIDSIIPRYCNLIGNLSHFDDTFINH